MLSGALHAQMGVAPSQTGMFFNDIRDSLESGARGNGQPRLHPRGPRRGRKDFTPLKRASISAYPSMSGWWADRSGSSHRAPGGHGAGDGFPPRSYSRRMASSTSGYTGTYPSSNTYLCADLCFRSISLQPAQREPRSGEHRPGPDGRRGIQRQHFAREHLPRAPHGRGGCLECGGEGERRGSSSIQAS